jgi:hypothetical protein
MAGLEELEMPVEVWKAVEGDRADLVALLRSDKPLSRWTRNALADFLAGDLKPVKIPRGRQQREKHWGLLSSVYYGHDPTTPLGWAGVRYEDFRRFIRRKRWHIGHPGWSERLAAKIAKRHGVDLDRFLNYLKRPRRQPKKVDRPVAGPDAVNRWRTEIALEVRRTKTRHRD